MSAASRRSSREEYPDATLSLSCVVLAGISRIRARGDDAGRRLRQAAHGTLSQARASGTRRRTSGQAVPGHAVERRRRQRRTGGAQADHDGAFGPGGRRARQRGHRRDRRLSGSRDARCRRHLDRSVPDRRRQAARHQWRIGRSVSGAHPDDRHRDHRHRRRLDRLDLAAKAISRSARAAPAPSPDRCAIRTAATSRPSPTPIWCSGGFRRR